MDKIQEYQFCENIFINQIPLSIPKRKSGFASKFHQQKLVAPNKTGRECLRLNIKVNSELSPLYPTSIKTEISPNINSGYPEYNQEHNFIDTETATKFQREIYNDDIERHISKEFCPAKIINNLFLGNEEHASSYSVLKDLNIGYILNVAKHDTCKNYNEKKLNDSILGIKYKNHYWDHNQINISSEFRACFDFINTALSQNKAILVHCQLGVSRSATLVIAYLMYHKQVSFKTAYDFVKKKSPKTCPNIFLVSQLIEYEKSNGLNLL
ncbi:Dual specificity protein phosphatase 9 [Smittium culicis]|uniref:protein-tyrosine-phosphatase n=1 Tax=Smittium culicis TaxID=133412 RepID=A0A1R1Y7S4_9FUNG|nr:Dual specificity protein phosphatase 9 [Smittium culicis]